MKLETHIPAEILRAEIERIVERRKVVRVDAERLEAAANGAPSVDAGLVGLGISGGGIRSSTFSLGVLQSIARAGLFKHLDYISTVSGGGYTGSLLSSVLREPLTGERQFPLAKPDGDQETALLQHLRNGSNYLSPGGLLNKLRLPAVGLRGSLLNLLLFLPWIMLGAAGTEVIYERTFAWDFHYSDLKTWTEALRSGYQGPLFVCGLVIALYMLTGAIFKGRWQSRDYVEHVLAGVIGALVLYAFVAPLKHLIVAAIELPLFGPHGFARILDRNLELGAWMTVVVGLVGGTMLFKASQSIGRVVSNLALLAVGIAGPAVVFGLYLLMLVAQADSPFLRRYTELERGQPGVVVKLPLSVPLCHELHGKGVDYEDLGFTFAMLTPQGRWVFARPDKVRGAASGGAQGLRPGDFQAAADEADSVALERSDYYRLVPVGGGRALTAMRAGQALGTDADGYIDLTAVRNWDLFGARLHFGGAAGAQTLMSDGVFLVLAVLLVLLNYFIVDVNRSSLHGFYRDRLSRLFLVECDAEGRVQHSDELKLSDLSPPGSAAPYHLLNATLNLQGVKAGSARGRTADAFFFSKLYCGSPHTGYCETQALEAWDPHLNLGTAMAISAAAASPNMGQTTVPTLVFIMTVLNLRLGYWLPNPRQVAKLKKPPRALRRRPRTHYLIDEALSALTAERTLVNLTDGAHFENLGAYELLRRRCAVVIVVDGEGDPAMSFEGFTTLMRLARIDLGVTIDIDLTPLNRNEQGLSQGHVVVGAIRYGEHDGVEQVGSLVYIKASLTGAENPYVRRYQGENPTFPHQTTADQFFREVQFEAYRALGEQVGESVLRDAECREVWRKIGFVSSPA